MDRRGWLVAGAVAAIVVGELTLAADGAAAGVVVTDALAAAAFFGVAVLAADRPHGRRLATIAGVAGLAWLAANLVTGIAPLHRPLLVHAVLSSRDGRLRGRATQTVVLAAWLISLVAPNQPAANVALGAAVAGAGIDTFARSPIGGRAWAKVVAQAAVVLGVAISGPSFIRLLDPTNSDAEIIAVGYATLVATAGGILLVGVLFRGDGGSELADTVVELTDVGSRDVDEVVASLHRGKADASDPAIAAALTAVTELLEDNHALHAGLEAQVDEVRRSRLRLVEAADLERRRLARRLAESAGKHLAELDTTFGVLTGVAVDGGSEILVRAVKELAASRDDLEQLAMGLHPRVLVEEGLQASLLDLARGAVVPAEVSAPDARFPAVVETTVWYVCAEAAANVAKHAHARTMRITVAVESDQLVATVTDDGIGGAHAGPGSGLAGLADRLDAVGGHMELRSAPGRGTQLRAWVPVA